MLTVSDWVLRGHNIEREIAELKDSSLWYILTDNQKIHPGLSDPLGPKGDLFYHELTRERQK